MYWERLEEWKIVIQFSWALILFWWETGLQNPKIWIQVATDMFN